MLSDKLYVQQSLINNLFYLRKLREFCLNIELSFFKNNESYIQIANSFRKRYQLFNEMTLNLANGKIPQEIINSDSFVTNYTLDLEEITQELFNVDINTDITVKEMNLTGGDNFLVTSDLLGKISGLNTNILALTRNFIDYCKYLRQEMLNTKIFSYSYPLIITFIIDDATLYLRDMERIQQRISSEPIFIVNYGTFFTTNMIRICQFIIGLSDPNQTSIITNADNYRKIFINQLNKYKEALPNPENQIKINQETVGYLKNFGNFLSSLIQYLLNQNLYFIVEPIFFDNMLTEVNYFIYILTGSEYGIQSLLNK